RNQLECTIKDARDIAEKAACAALEHLGVGEATPFAYLSEQDRELRRKLRVHGRQLGDSLNGGKIQTMDRLIEEVAYEHWHRMIFARFLAENNLLMYPDPDDPVAVTFEECEDLAAEEGAANGWELAARFAARMLPQIFRLDSPVFQLVLPPEHQQKLKSLVADLPLEVFTASDSLGWVYQFWQAKKKDEINASEVKIGARELPAVTQLFTEPYMVSFLLDNSLGAWWAARRLTEADLQNASSEEELRRKAAIPGVPLEYLRFVQVEDPEGNKRWTPAAGTFDGWPEQLADLKTLDPCCGSGHFLVAAFLMLVTMRMERDSLSAKEAVDAVLRENIHGLELDQRCVELAAFALALTAWKYPGAGGYRVLPGLNVACSGFSVSVAKEEWKQLAMGKHNLRIALDWMYETFKDAPVLGSLLNPVKTDAAKLVHWDELSSAVEQALNQEQGEEQQEVAVVAQGLAKAATLLAGRYQWVITNVPYLVRGKQNKRLRDFCERQYSAAKNDLATVFLDRCLEFCVQGGTSSIVLPQNWLFLTSYKKFREKLLKNDTWHLIARLGPQAFQTPMWDFNVQLITISHGNSTKESGGLFGESDDGNLIRGVDVSEPRTAAEKAEQLLAAEIKSVVQTKQLENPDAVVVFQAVNNSSLLSEVATINYGSKPGQTDRVVKYHWEFFGIPAVWQLLESTPSTKRHYSGKEKVCLTLDEIDKQGIKEFGIRSQDVWGKPGIIQSQMREMPFSIYCSNIFDNNTSVLTQNNNGFLPSIFSFIESGEYLSEIRKLNQKLDVAAHTMVKVPFNLGYWTKVTGKKYPNGLPKPYTDDPTQWIFHGHPCGSVIWNEEKKWTAHGPLRTDDTVLHVAVARLLGYRWPAELDANMELTDEQREWVNHCEALAGYADEDGIVCIPPV
ncbi:MAG: N-6 DNA methylase, partial [Lentisphaerae bacterium]|nr:N-6 DNA methylase [Lentisphaerota bacterium]